jgi:cellulose synthase/poly-beta-1,6-N-acetylglucosamine synthase-like glycosyltransferase
MMEAIAISVFWISTALIALNVVGYPHLLRLLERLGVTGRCPRSNSGSESRRLPSVTMIVPVYNEERHIRWKIENCLALRYPADRLTILFVFDGCTDRSAEMAKDVWREHGRTERLLLRIAAANRGKVAVLNDEIARVSSEVVALVDASAWLPDDALETLVAHFADPTVGVVCPAYATADGSSAETAYWRLLTRLKQIESDMASVIGPHGACYLFRRPLWTPLPPDTINDDFVLPMQIVAKGFSARYDDRVTAREMERSSSRIDFRRRLRIGAGNLQQVVRLAKLASPARPALAFLFILGKGLRAFVPLLALLAIAASVQLGLQNVFPFALILAGAVVSLALFVVSQCGGDARLPKPFRLVAYVATWMVASAIGSLAFMTGSAGALWKTSNANKGAASP